MNTISSSKKTKPIWLKTSLIFVDIWESFMDGGQLDIQIQPDGLHPGEAGLILISEILYKSLESIDLSGKE